LPALLPPLTVLQTQHLGVLGLALGVLQGLQSLLFHQIPSVCCYLLLVDVLLQVLEVLLLPLHLVGLV
jgi:hypothetical protein